MMFAFAEVTSGNNGGQTFTADCLCKNKHIQGYTALQRKK